MPNKMTSKDWAARAKAYTEAAAYLERTPSQVNGGAQAAKVANLLRREAAKCDTIAGSAENEEAEAS